MVGATLDLDTSKDEKLYIPVTGGRCFPAGLQFSDETKQNDFEVGKSRSAGFSVLIFGTDPISPLVRFISHIWLYYPTAEETKFVEVPRLEEVWMPLFSIFVGNAYHYHGVCSWCVSHGLLY